MKDEKEKKEEEEEEGGEGGRKEKMELKEELKRKKYTVQMYFKLKDKRIKNLTKLFRYNFP